MLILQLHHRHVQRRRPELVADCGVGAVLQQCLDDGDVPVPARRVERRLSVRPGAVHDIHDVIAVRRRRRSLVALQLAERPGQVALPGGVPEIAEHYFDVDVVVVIYFAMLATYVRTLYYVYRIASHWSLFYIVVVVVGEWDDNKSTPPTTVLNTGDFAATIAILLL